MYFGDQKCFYSACSQHETEVLILDRNIKVISPFNNFKFTSLYRLVELIENKMQCVMNEIDFERCFGYTEINFVSEHMLSFSINNGSILKNEYENALKICIDKCLMEVLSEEGGSKSLQD